MSAAPTGWPAVAAARLVDRGAVHGRREPLRARGGAVLRRGGRPAGDRDHVLRRVPVLHVRRVPAVPRGRRRPDARSTGPAAGVGVGTAATSTGRPAPCSSPAPSGSTGARGTRCARTSAPRLPTSGCGAPTRSARWPSSWRAGWRGTAVRRSRTPARPPFARLVDRRPQPARFGGLRRLRRRRLRRAGDRRRAQRRAVQPRARSSGRSASCSAPPCCCRRCRGRPPPPRRRPGPERAPDLGGIRTWAAIVPEGGTIPARRRFPPGWRDGIARSARPRHPPITAAGRRHAAPRSPRGAAVRRRSTSKWAARAAGRSSGPGGSMASVTSCRTSSPRTRLDAWDDSPRVGSSARTTFTTTVRAARAPLGRHAVAYSATRQSTTTPRGAAAGSASSRGSRQTSGRWARPGRRPHMFRRYGGTRSPTRSAPQSAEMTTIHDLARRRDAASSVERPRASKSTPE